MLFIELCDKGLNGFLICTLEHDALALCFGAEGSVYIGGRTLEPDLFGINGNIVKAPNLNGLVICFENSLGSHITRRVKFFDCRKKNGHLCFDNGIAVLKLTLNDNLIAFDIELLNVGDLRDVQLFRNLGTDLCGVAVDCLPAAVSEPPNSLPLMRIASSAPIASASRIATSA